MKDEYLQISKKDFHMMGPNSLLLLEELVSFCPVIKKEMRVLDLGCGKALTSLYLAKELGAVVYANDLWIPATENYERIKEWGLEKNIIPIHADANELPYADGFFDAIVSVDAFQYFGTQEGYFEQKLWNLVKPGGTILLAFVGINEEYEGRVPELLLEWAKEESYMFHSISYWREKLGKSTDIENISCKKMDCFEPAWKDWIETGHEFALRDHEFLQKGLDQVINFISIVITKKDNS